MILRVFNAVMFGLVLLLSGVSFARAGIDEGTTCPAAVKMFETEDPASVREVALYIEETMQARESEIRGRMLKRLSRDGYKKVMVTALAFCRNRPYQTLHQAAIDAYDGFVALQKELGVE